MCQWNIRGTSLDTYFVSIHMVLLLTFNQCAYPGLLYPQKHIPNTDQLLRLWHGKLFLSFLDSFTGSALTVLCHYLFIVTSEGVFSFYYVWFFQ